MGLAFVIDIFVVAGDMNIGYMGVGICIGVPWVVDDNDLDLEIGIPADTLDRDIVDWDSIFSLFCDHCVLDLCYYYPIFYPYKNYLDHRNFYPCCLCHGYLSHFHPTVYVDLDMINLVHALYYNESLVVLDHGQLHAPGDHTGYWSCLHFHGHRYLYHVRILCHIVPHYNHYPLY